MAIIELENISKTYPSGDSVTHALQHINLNINAGELTMIVGPSGCGKTTLISVIANILDATEGKVTINGIVTSALSNKKKVQFRKENMGFVFQQFNLIPALTISENAAVPLIAAGMNFAEAVKKAKEQLTILGLEKHLDKFPNQLSGGQQQRVAFARALIHKPKVIVCDEPTSALDANTGHQVLEILKEIAKNPDCAVIVVTHDSRIFEFADRIVHMSDGKIEKEEKRSDK